jgi:hypothetical protein
VPFFFVWSKGWWCGTFGDVGVVECAFYRRVAFGTWLGLFLPMWLISNWRADFRMHTSLTYVDVLGSIGDIALRLKALADPARVNLIVLRP